MIVFARISTLYLKTFARDGLALCLIIVLGNVGIIKLFGIIMLICMLVIILLAGIIILAIIVIALGCVVISTFVSLSIICFIVHLSCH